MNRLNVLVWLLLAVSLYSFSSVAETGESNWSVDVGLRWFKHSADGNEIGYNAVFDRWERINQDKDAYDVAEYQPLDTLFFNFNFGADALFRWRKYLMLKLGYDHSNSAGIGGKGHIEYSDFAGNQFREEKTFSTFSHQLNLFVGPIVPIENRAEIYLGFAPFAPTWVRYKEKYKMTADGQVSREYDKTFKGFFGNCRANLGIQVRVWKGLKLGGEITFAVFNYMKLSSGDLEDSSFKFPMMKWNFTIRYELF